jgi:hypothetical protein
MANQRGKRTRSYEWLTWECAHCGDMVPKVAIRENYYGGRWVSLCPACWTAVEYVDALRRMVQGDGEEST